MPEEVIVPTPPGHRRTVICFRNGNRDAIADIEPAELAQRLAEFRAGPQWGGLQVDRPPALELRDAVLGEPYLLTRAGADEIVAIRINYLSEVRDNVGRPASGIEVVRGLPAGM